MHDELSALAIDGRSLWDTLQAQRFRLGADNEVVKGNRRVVVPLAMCEYTLLGSKAGSPAQISEVVLASRRAVTILVSPPPFDFRGNNPCKRMHTLEQPSTK
jgi:hypothetical protein